MFTMIEHPKNEGPGTTTEYVMIYNSLITSNECKDLLSL